MDKNCKTQIYHGIIQYLLDFTHYTIEDIADLSDSSIKNISTIYFDGLLPQDFHSELQLLRLYHFILEMKLYDKNFTCIA